MLKKIICPTDFSPIAENAIAYAAKLCQLSGTNLEILHVHPEGILDTIIPGVLRRNEMNLEENRMEELCKEVTQAFHVSCTGHLELSRDFLDQRIASEAMDDQLIVMGTNGADDLFQRIFGSTTFSTIKHSKCPVIAIPANVEYATIQKILFAWDYSSASKKIFPYLKNLLELFNPEIEFLHLSRHDTPISWDVFQAVKEQMEELFADTKIKVSFSRIFTSDVIAEIDGQMKEKGSQVLMLQYHGHEPGNDLFGNILIRRMALHATYPIMVLHEME